MGASAKYPGPPDKLALYEAVVATQTDVPRRGARNPYTSLNGHMTSFLDPTGSMGLRLPPADRGDFITSYQTGLAQQYGSTMKEYVVVPSGLLADTDELRTWFSRSLAWVASLPPKPTKK